MATQPKIVLGAEDRTAAAFAAVSKRVDGLGGDLDKFKALAIGALGALAVPVSVAGLVGLTNKARDAIGQIKNLAEASGSSIENVSALDRIARTTGGAFDQVAGTIVKFNQVLKDADPDRGAGAVLKALNLDIEELKRLDPAEALRLTAVALEGFADDGARARAVQELLGESVKDMAPFLRELAKAGKLQAAVTTQQSEEVDKFNKELAKLQTSAEDAGRAISINLITDLNRVIDRFRTGQREGKSFWQIVFRSDEELKRRFAQAKGELPADSGRFQPTYSADDQSVAELAKLTRQNKLPSLKPKNKNSPNPNPNAKDPYAEAQRYLDALQKQLEATEKLTETEQALRDLQLGRLGKVTDEQRRQILATAQQLDLDRELTAATKESEELRAETARKAREAEEERIQRIKDLVDAGATQQLEQQRDVMRELTEAYEKGELGLVGSEEALRKYAEAAQAFLGIAEEQKDKLSELDQFTQRAAENIQDYLGDSFANILEGKFDDIGSAFTSLINRMVAEAAAAQLSRYMFGDLVGGGTGSGAVGGLFKDVVGGLFGDIPQLDTGTDFVPRDMLAVIHKGEAVIPAAQNAGAGARGAMTVINRFSIQGPVDRRTEAQIAKAAARGLQSAQRNM